MVSYWNKCILHTHHVLVSWLEFSLLAATFRGISNSRHRSLVPVVTGLAPLRSVVTSAQSRVGITARGAYKSYMR